MQAFGGETDYLSFNRYVRYKLIESGCLVSKFSAVAVHLVAVLIT